MLDLKVARADKQRRAAVRLAALGDAASGGEAGAPENDESESEEDDEDDDDEEGHWGERARVLFECSVDEFGDVVQSLKVYYKKKRLPLFFLPFVSLFIIVLSLSV